METRKNIMNKHFTLALAVFLSLLAVTHLASASVTAQGGSLGRSLADEVNRYRQSRGLKPLVWDDRLFNAAHAHTDLMGALNQFSHQLPGEPAFSTRIQQAGFDPMYAAGEIIAAGNYDVGRTLQQWQNSSGHDGIMRGDYTSIGCELKQYPGTTYGSLATCDLGKTDITTPTTPSITRPGMVGGRIYRFQFYLPSARDPILDKVREVCGSQQVASGRYQGQVGAGCYFYGTTGDNQPPGSKVGWAYVEFRDFTAYYRGMKDTFLSLMPSDPNLWRFVETSIPGVP